MIILKNSIGILNKDTPRSENIGLIIEVIIFIHLFLRIFFPSKAGESSPHTEIPLKYPILQIEYGNFLKPNIEKTFSYIN